MPPATLCGLTEDGGTGTNCFGICCGTVFKVTPSGTLPILCAFTGGADRSIPPGMLLRDDGCHGLVAPFWTLAL
jgi:hypothetical protein